MCNSILVSIIIPLYNNEKYIAHALESCINQEYGNIEIIVIDDGSTDNSSDIVKNYSSKDTRIKYIYQENGGVSSARNNGMSNAKGEYITFLDSDDYLASDTLVKNIQLLESAEDNLDALFFPLTRVDETGNILHTVDKDKLQNISYKEELIVDNKEIYNKISKREIAPIACSIIFRKDKITHKFVNSRYEDTIFIMEFLRNEMKCILSPYGNYYYVDRDGSFIAQNFTPEKWISYTRSLLATIVTGKLLFPDRSKEFENSITSIYYNLKYLKFKKRENTEYSKPLEFLKKDCKYINKFNVRAYVFYIIRCARVVILNIRN